MALARLFFDNDAEFDRVLSNRLPPIINGALNGLSGRLLPKFDVLQKEDTVTVLAELPGVKKEDVKVDLVNDRLTISGSTKEDAEYTDSDHHITHRERAFGTFTRALQVPAGIKAEEIKASMENGILKIVLPSKPKEPTSAQITIT